MTQDNLDLQTTTGRNVLLSPFCNYEAQFRNMMACEVRKLFQPYGWTGSNPAKWGYLADPSSDHDDYLPWTTVAFVEGEIVGSASLVRRDHSGLDCGPWLAGLVVRPDHKKTGIGTFLIREIELHAAYLHRCGHPDLREGKIYLDTERTINNFDSVAMYTRLGWKFLSSEYEHRQDGIVMSKSVKS